MAMRDRLLPALLLAAVALPAGAQDLLIRAGHVLDVDTPFWYEGDALAALKFIEEAASAALFVSYYA